MNQRIHKVIAISVALLLGGLAYALICRWLGFGIPCGFYVVTGWQCPGCGVSRMCLCLLRGDLAGAFAVNPVLLLSLPLFIALAVDVAVRYIRTGVCRPQGWSAVLVWVLIVVMLIYGVLRNL